MPIISLHSKNRLVFGAFRKIIESDYSIRHFCPSTWNTSVTNRRIFMKFDISTFFFENLSSKFKNCLTSCDRIQFFFFLYFADCASQYIYLNINQLDALNFIMSLFHASTCFEHTCSSSGCQNCTIQPLVSSHL